MEKLSRYFYRKRHKPGTDPGTLTASENAIRTSIQIIAYGPDKVQEATLSGPEEIKAYIGTAPVLWLNVEGLADTETISGIGQIFGLHPLALEDTVNVHQRPKTEDYDDYIFTVCRMLNESPANDPDLEQVSLFMGPGFVISFQERPGDCWNILRERIRKGVGKRIRQSGADYLFYLLLDSIVDEFFPMLEKFGDHLDGLEDLALGRPRRYVMSEIQTTKRMLYSLRHAVWPLREALAQIAAHENLVAHETKVFIRDCQDHVIQILDIIESYRERASGLVDIYLSTISNRMNEVMKVLAIITTIFMPLSLITGVYGMNFENMPELRLRYGYHGVLVVMGLLALGMIGIFYRVGWLGLDGTGEDDPREKR